MPTWSTHPVDCLPECNACQGGTIFLTAFECLFTIDADKLVYRAMGLYWLYVVYIKIHNFLVPKFLISFDFQTNGPGIVQKEKLYCVSVNTVVL